MTRSLTSDGFDWDYLPEKSWQELLSACRPLFDVQDKKFGIRDAVSRSVILEDLVQTHLTPIARRHLNSQAFLVRSTLFDKPLESNWAVPWHQDVTIEVKERHKVDGFGPWTTKDGLLSVQPPESVLEKMLTLRLHFDNTDETNGALLVESGSHLQGKLRIGEIQAISPICCNCKAGDILLMKPLLFHASNRSISDRPRRVLHIDFAYEALPVPLSWRLGA